MIAAAGPPRPMSRAAAAQAASNAIPVPPIRWLAILPPIIMIGGAVAAPRPGVARGQAAPGAGRHRSPPSVISGARAGHRLWQWADVQQHGAPHLRSPKRPSSWTASASSSSILVAIAMLLSALVGDGYLRREGMQGAEFHVLAMVSASGAMLMAMANDLIIVFLGLEILSIALYVLTAFNYKRRPPRARRPSSTSSSAASPRPSSSTASR